MIEGTDCFQKRRQLFIRTRNETLSNKSRFQR
jgi:hypothetical protein